MKRETDLARLIRDQASELRIENPDAPPDDMQAIAAIVGDARVVGLGEPTHGTREVVQLRRRITSHLVQNLGFRLVGIEADWSGCLAINDFVVDGVGSPEAALAGQGYWMWQTDEMLGFITWLRDHNAGLPRTKRVQLFGFDAGRADSTTHVLSTRLERLSAPAELCKSGSFDAIRAMNPWSPPDNGDADRVEKQIADIKTWLADRRHEQAIHATSTDRWQAMQCAIVLEQINSRRTAPTPTSHYAIRDRAMAMNVERHLDDAGKTAKTVIWAHNGHITRDSLMLDDNSIATMGRNLSARYQAGYLPIGFTIGYGRFLAYTGTETRSPKLKAVEIDPPPTDSLDYSLMTDKDASAVLLDLRTCGEPLRGWLSSPLVTRWAGAGFTTASDMETPIVPTAGYDALISVKRSTPAHLLPSAGHCD